jgi:peptide/nickel transport system permease protein
VLKKPIVGIIIYKMGSIPTFLLKRILIAIPIIILISIICFAIIQAPPGDYIDSYTAVVMATRGEGGTASPEFLEFLRERYGLDQPFWVQYWRWVRGFPKGDFGIAMSVGGVSVASLLRERLPLTIVLNLLALFFALSMALPIGVYSATHKYNFGDIFFTFSAFVGISIPGFIMGLLIFAVSIFWFDSAYIGGLFSRQFIGEPWTWAKIVDFIRHLPLPILAIGIAQIANTTRIMRGNTLDVLNQLFIQTARSKGLREPVVVWRHAARISINPIVSRVGVFLPEILATEMLVSIVLGLQTIGPLFYHALISQDMYLAGTILLLVSVLLVIGNLVADVILAWIDPRIKL